jgi:hypothetical protein
MRLWILKSEAQDIRNVGRYSLDETVLLEDAQTA